jgi:hypothetical protein
MLISFLLAVRGSRFAIRLPLVACRLSPVAYPLPIETTSFIPPANKNKLTR